MSSMDGARFATMEMPGQQWSEQEDWAYGPWIQAAGGICSVTTHMCTTPLRSCTPNRSTALGKAAASGSQENEIAAKLKDKDEETGQALDKGGGNGGRKIGSAGRPQLIRLMAEMALQGAAVPRDLAGFLYDTKTRYHEQAAGAVHNLSPPHLHMWPQLVEVMLPGPKLASDDRAVLQGYMTEAKEAEPDVVLLGMRQRRLSRTNSPTTKRLQLRVEEPKVRRRCCASGSCASSCAASKPAIVSKQFRQAAVIPSYEGGDLSRAIPIRCQPGRRSGMRPALWAPPRQHRAAELGLG